jgi:hypothetical protein
MRLAAYHASSSVKNSTTDCVRVCVWEREREVAPSPSDPWTHLWYPLSNEWQIKSNKVLLLLAKRIEIWEKEAIACIASHHSMRATWVCGWWTCSNSCCWCCCPGVYHASIEDMVEQWDTRSFPGGSSVLSKVPYMSKTRADLKVQKGIFWAV